MIRSRMLILVLALCCAWPALADIPLPRPRVTGPVQVNNRGPLTLHFSYPPVHWTNKSFWELVSWTQYWHCLPGKDSAPTPIALQSEPWPGQTNPCTKDDNYYLGLDPNRNGDIIQVPKQGGIPAIGTWYVRVRLAWHPVHHPNIQPELGPWSAWHRVTVVQSFKDAIQAPKILAPSNNHQFAHQNVDVRVAAGTRHADPGRWEYAFEWQRGNYYTKADNDYANPHPKPTDFPRAVGQVSPFRAWQTGMPVQTLAESASPSTLHLDFTGLRSGRHDLSYIYRFRVREHLRGSTGYGPWSGWRSFIVTDPVTLRPMPHRMMHLKTH